MCPVLGGDLGSSCCLNPTPVRAHAVQVPFSVIVAEGVSASVPIERGGVDPVPLDVTVTFVPEDTTAAQDAVSVTPSSFRLTSAAAVTVEFVENAYATGVSSGLLAGHLQFTVAQGSVTIPSVAVYVPHGCVLE